MNRKTKNIKFKFINKQFTKHGNFLIRVFIKNLLKKGKESVASTIMQTTLFLLELKFRSNAIKILEQAVLNSKIDFNAAVLSSKKTFSKLKLEINPYCSISLAIKNLIKVTVEKKSELSISERLCNAISDAYFEKGEAVKKHTENLQLLSSCTLPIDSEDDYSDVIE